MSLPTAKEDLDLAFRNAGESITSRSPTVVTCLLGTSTPTTAILSGMAEIRTLDAPRARAKSSCSAHHLIQPDTLSQLDLIPGHRRPPGHIADSGINMEALQRLRQAMGIVPHFRGAVALAAFVGLQQLHRRESIFRLFRHGAFFNLPRHLPGGFLGLLPGDYRAPPGSSGSGAASSATGENSTGSAIFSVCIVSGFCFGLRGWGAPSTGRSISASWRFFRACST